MICEAEGNYIRWSGKYRRMLKFVTNKYESCKEVNETC